jgi:glycosyltransferase involved in cell wall biosynthesis
MTNKLNIAVFVKSSIQSGGGYQYEYMVLNLLKKYGLDDFNIKFYTLNKDVLEDYKELNIDIEYISENIIQKFIRLNSSNIFSYRILKIFLYKFSKIEKILMKNKTQLVYFLSPDMLSQGILNIPYIFTLWDLEHLQNMIFPEVSSNRIFETREYLYQNSLKKSYKTIVDSKYGKDYAIKKYNLDDNKVEILKYLPNIRINKNSSSSSAIDIKTKYDIKGDYIYYPALLIAHKNHIYILKAIKILKEKYNIEIYVIFSGANRGNLDYILKKIKEFNIDNLVKYIGFTPNEEIEFLYKQSLAMVMPTYLGPTNIPPLEAFAYEVPVCYSDLPSFRDQVGDAAFLMDLNNPNTLVSHLQTILKDKKLVSTKIELGKQILNSWDKKDFYNKLKMIFDDYMKIRDSWE